MLPPLLGLNAIRGTRRRMLARLDAYTLWAFNTQPPLAPRRDHGTYDAGPDRDLG